VKAFSAGASALIVKDQVERSGMPGSPARCSMESTWLAARGDFAGRREKLLHGGIFGGGGGDQADLETPLAVCALRADEDLPRACFIPCSIDIASTFYRVS